jgi:hypothetical protein
MRRTLAAPVFGILMLATMVETFSRRPRQDRVREHRGAARYRAGAKVVPKQ